MNEPKTSEGRGCRFFVSGSVQGVGFRYATARKARELGVTGHARNLPDGRVEVIACGDETTLAKLREWLQEGPSAARVREVTVESAAPESIPADFTIR